MIVTLIISYGEMNLIWVVFFPRTPPYLVADVHWNISSIKNQLQNPPRAFFYSEGTYVLRWFEFPVAVLRVGESSILQWLWGFLAISIQSGSRSHPATLSLLRTVMNRVQHTKIAPAVKPAHVPPVLVGWCVSVCRDWQLIFRADLKQSPRIYSSVHIRHQNK